MLSIPLLMETDQAKEWARSKELHSLYVEDEDSFAAVYEYSLTPVQPGLTQLTVEVIGNEELVRDLIRNLLEKK